MRHVLLVCTLLIHSFSNAMPSEKDILAKSFGGSKNLKYVPTMRYNLKDCDLSFVQIKDWNVFDVQRKIIWHEYCFRNQNCKDKKPQDHKHIRANMKSVFIKKILQDELHSQVECIPGRIIIHENYRNYQEFYLSN